MNWPAPQAQPKPTWRDSLRRYWWAWVGGAAFFVVGVFTDWIDRI